MFYRHRDDVFGDLRSREESQRKFVRTERLDQEAVVTSKIADEAVTEISVVQEVGDIDFAETYGTYQELLNVFYTATGSRFQVAFRDLPAGVYNEGDDTTIAATWRLRVLSVAGEVLSSAEQNAALISQLTGIEQLFTAAAQDPNISFIQESVTGVQYNIVVDFTVQYISGSTATIDMTSTSRILTVETIKK